MFPASCKIPMSPICTKIIIIQGTIVNNAYSKFKFNPKHLLDTNMLFIILFQRLYCIRILFSVCVNKTVNSKFSKINTEGRTVACIISTKFKLKLLHSLGTYRVVIIWHHKSKGIKFLFCSPEKKLWTLHSPKSIGFVRW